MAGDTTNVWKDIELIIYPDHFCTSCQISSMKKKSGSKNPLKQKSPFKWVFMDIFPSTSPKILTSDTTFLIIFELLMPTLKFQNFMVWRKSEQKKFWIIWICSNPDLENRGIWTVVFRNNISRYREEIYLGGVQIIMPNLRSSFDMSVSGTTVNERTSKSIMENVAYNCTLSYCIC